MDLGDRRIREAWARRRAAESFGMQVASLRKQRNWTRRDLASAAGLDRATVAGIETGKRMSNLGTLIKIAAAFDVALDVRIISFSDLRRPQSFHVARPWSEEQAPLFNN